MKTSELTRFIRDVYVKVVLYTNSLYTWWELAIFFGIGFGLGFYFAY